MMRRTARILAASAALLALGGCAGDPTEPEPLDVVSCPPAGAATGMTVLGCAGPPRGPLTGEVAVLGTRAYTSTWSASSIDPGNRIDVWDVSGAVPRLVDTLIVPGVVLRVGDVAISDDGRLLVAPTEPAGTLAVYELNGTAKPQLRSLYKVPLSDGAGVHTAKLARVNGVQYAFAQLTNGRLHVSIIDLSDPAAPREVGRIPAADFIHDVFIRWGRVFAADWDQGVSVWDIGGAGAGGTPAAPVRIGARATTVGGNAHNVWWFVDPALGSTLAAARYLFVGEEQPGFVGSTARGDIHVLDMSNPDAPREIAFYSVPGAGTHNFWMDEEKGILYAAYYNGGLRALDVRGDLGTCTAAQKSPDGRCDLAKMGREIGVALAGGSTYVWGVQFAGDAVYASDMLNGLWKLRPIGR